MSTLLYHKTAFRVIYLDHFVPEIELMATGPEGQYPMIVSISNPA